MKTTTFSTLLLLLPLGCADKFPLPDTFDAAFTVGQICAPHNVATGGTNVSYPVRFDICRYRCIDLDRSTAQVQTVYSCQAGICQMIMLATVTAHTDPSEEDCDARDLVDPPQGECENESFEFDVSVPMIDGAPATGDFIVTIPYLELEQGQTVVDRLEAGEDPTVVFLQEIGVQNYPQRQFSLNFDAAHPPVSEHADIPPGDCYSISAP